MADALALKRLTASDLTFFEALYRRLDAGNQKAINLNADVLTGRLFPDLEAAADASPDGEIGLVLTVHGPDAAPALRLRRKIVKGAAYKNWRLNGEFIYDPEGQRGRFDVLKPGDLAVMAFRGRPAPDAMTLVLLAQDAAQDAGLHAALRPFIRGGRMTMAALRPGDIAAAIAASRADPTHPIASLAFDAEEAQALEDVALGGTKGARKLARTRRARPVTAEELAKAKQAAERTGAEGEAFVDLHLTREEARGAAQEHVWVSRTNAIAPFDFLVVHNGLFTEQQRIDVKSTRGPFTADFHMSLAEVTEAAGSPQPYLIYRVFSLTADQCELRVSGDIRDFAKRLLAAHNGAMFAQITADSFSIPPAAEGLTWSPPLTIRAEEEPEETLPDDEEEEEA